MTLHLLMAGFLVISAACGKVPGPYGDGRVSRVLEGFGDLVKSSHDAPHDRYAMLAEGAGLLAASGDEEGAARLVEQAVAALDQPDFAPQTRIDVRKIVLHAVARVRLRRGDRASAAKALAELSALDESAPNPNRFARLLDLSRQRALAGDMDGASQDAEKAIRMAEALPLSAPVGRGLKPPDRPVALLQAAGVLDVAGNHPEAREARERSWKELARIADPEARRRGEVAMIVETAGLGDVGSALDRLDALRIVPGQRVGEDRASILRSMAVAASESDIAGAIAVASRIESPIDRLSALDVVATRCAASGRWKEAASAREAASAIELGRPVPFVLAELAWAKAKAGDPDAARRAARLAMDGLRAVAHEADSGTYSPVFVMTRAAEALWVAGDKSEARDMLRLARKTLESIPDRGGSRPLAYVRIAEAEVTAGDPGAALTHLGSASNADPELDRLATQPAIMALLTDDKFDEALAGLAGFSTRVQNVRMTAGLAQAVAEAEARSGDPDRATRWAEAQANPTTKARALLGIARGLLDRPPPNP